MEEGTCIICAVKAPCSELTKPTVVQSIESLRNAAIGSHAVGCIEQAAEHEGCTPPWSFALGSSK